MAQQYLHIELGTDAFILDFEIYQTSIASAWVERMDARELYPLDHPRRFYGFDSQEQEQARANQMMVDCITTINAHERIIDREFTWDQDCLNYLHNIFERYHGLLDQQVNDFWHRAPSTVRQALAELNLAVHRCESIKYQAPRFVCTWYGMPKIKKLTDEQMSQHGNIRPRFGSVCINYAEVGKTLEDLAHDNDNYIGDDAFRPFQHYSADFVVRLFEKSHEHVAQTLESMQTYYYQHHEFFKSRDLPNFNHPQLLPLRFPVAQLIETMPREQLLDQIKQHQYITRVYIDETMHHSNSR